jgi:bacteriorhodopsin
MMEVPTLEGLLSVGGAAVLTSILVEILKRAWNPSEEIRDRFLPLVSVLVGIGVVLLAVFGLGVGGRAEIVQAIITGIFAGVTASGLYALATSPSR